ncbi:MULTISPECIES: hypothetical protein [Pseudomonas]|uniref:DUF2384 domain-containing protein n=1 Tax=Pseudomonas putida TaxID=303 RepID=A0A7V8J0S4_PSEPU|nr:MULTISPECIES: hypothetical protein [Pseudomonas]KAF0250908.1 hypothetical protein GN299_31375 [Pseudomonas putida]MDS9593411.1 hypothetical protein [Pseudomonas sp. HTZ1]
MSIRPTFSREVAMLEKGKARLLSSGDFLTAEAFAVLAQLSTHQSSRELRAWKRAGNIFSLTHEDKEYFPLYAFDPTPGYRPFLPLAAIITTLGSSKHDWAMALWFGSSNSYLGGQMPKAVMMDEPTRVMDAARSEAYGALQG